MFDLGLLFLTPEELLRLQLAKPEVIPRIAGTQQTLIIGLTSSTWLLSKTFCLQKQAGVCCNVRVVS